MRIAEAAAAEAGKVGSMREGVLEQKFLLTGDDESPSNYVLNVGRTGTGGWGTPRHRHNFDQIRFVLKGSYPYATGKVMPEGSVAYFPESVHYGPQDRPEGLEMMVIQFGGASGGGFLSVARREAANAALAAKGEFKNGVYTYYDENNQKHNKDGSAACFEEATGQKLEFAPPRYSDVILMEAQNYEWIPGSTEGVYFKHLGAFTERNTKIAMIRLEPGAVYNGGEQSSIEVLFLSKGSVAAGGRQYGEKTGFEFLPNEGPIPVTAVAESEFLSVVLPKF